MADIKVRNNLKGPVMFRVPGRSVHLAPGQTVQLPGQFKDAAELKKLCLRQAVSVLREKPDKTISRPAGAEEEKAETPGQKKMPKPSKPSKPIKKKGKKEE